MINWLTPAPITSARSGDTLIIKAAVNHAWSSSMEIGVNVSAESGQTGGSRHVVSANLTFVALDDEGEPHSVPTVLLQTAIEKRRFKEAGKRREQRLRNKADKK